MTVGGGNIPGLTRIMNDVLSRLSRVLPRSAKGLLSGLRRDRSGSIAPLMALSLLTVIGGAGLAVDYGRIYGVQLKLQTALDAATLATARKARMGGDDLDATFATFFNASRPSQGDLSIAEAAVDTTNARQISGRARGAMRTVFMSILGFETIEISVASQASYTFEKTEVALVLDNTGSMSGPRIAALKDAAGRLIDMLTANLPEPDAVRFSLVPFGQYVNVGQAYRNASWMTVPLDGSTTTRQCWNTYPNAVSSNCRMQTYTGTNDGVPTTYQAEVCDWNWGNPVEQCGDVTTTQTWNGCAGARSYPLNIRDESYATRIPGIMNVTCPSPIVPLTADTATIKDAIRDMTTVGETYIPAGIVWGMRALSPEVPFEESAGNLRTAAGEPLRKFMIIMTDGQNTKSPNYPDHEGSDTALANTLTAEACANAKAQRIQIFTIAFEVTDNNTRAMLRSCASSGGGYFEAADGAALDASFQAIGQQMTLLRLSQ